MTRADAFDRFEAAGWERAAASYDALVGSVARRADDALLDAAHVGAGTRVLDLGCGPGHLGGRALTRSATVAAVDVAPAMLHRTRTGYPAISTVLAAADRLPFAAAGFDAVVGNLLVLHLARPDRGVAEAARVLRSGGRLALTTWDAPERCRLLGVVLDALAAAGAEPPADLPPGPAFFAFADRAAFTALLVDAGFVECRVETLGFAHPVVSEQELWWGLAEGTVRMAVLLRTLPRRTRTRARSELVRHLERYRADVGFRLPVSMQLAVGRRP
jgi:SAM-dependent methyltransferase